MKAKWLAFLDFSLVPLRPCSSRVIFLCGSCLSYIFTVRNPRQQPFLPASLFDAIINSKHLPIFRLYLSEARIERDIRARYHCSFRELKALCLICQFIKNLDHEYTLKQADYIHAPRVTCAIDLIPSMPPTKSDHTGALLEIDLFTGSIQIHPIKSKKVKDLIEAIKATIIRPFGIPKFLRSQDKVSLLISC